MDAIEKLTKERHSKNAFMHHNFMEVELVEMDRAVISLEVRPESKNPYGTVHGGAMFTLADNATGTAAHTDGRSYLTQGGDLHFLSNVTEGVVRAEGRVRHRGRRTCLVDVDITGEDGTLLATGAFTLFCVGEKKE